MSRASKFHNPEGLYFISFATVGWVDVFTRPTYKEILVESLSFCIKEKGLMLHAWVLMSNHVHMIASSKEENSLPDIIRDLKKYTSKQVLQAIQENGQESRREWMLSVFKKAGEYNSNNVNFQFWRQNNKPIELTDNEQIEKALDYVHNNPVEAGIVVEPHHYVYSNARNYSGSNGLISVDLI